MDVFVLRNNKTGKFENRAYTEYKYAASARRGKIKGEDIAWTEDWRFDRISDEEKRKISREYFSIMKISGPPQEVP